MTTYLVDPAIEAYAKRHTQPEPDLLQTIVSETEANIPDAHMLVGRVEGRLLKMLVQLVQAKNILEIGTFTGYSALCMAEGLSLQGRLITCEIDPKMAAIAQRYFDASPYAAQIECRVGPALESMEALNDQTFDLIFIDADKDNLFAYYEKSLAMLRSGGIIVIDNTLWRGEVLAPEKKSAKIIDGLNAKIKVDERVENVLLPLRDGIQVIRKK